MKNIVQGILFKYISFHFTWKGIGQHNDDKLEPSQ